MKVEILNILRCPSCFCDKLHIDYEGSFKNDVESGWIRCSSCGSRYQIIKGIPKMLKGKAGMDHHGEVRDANIEYHDKIADLYDGSSGEACQQASFYQNRLARILRELRSRSSGDRLLDVGCGTGKVLRHAANCFRSAVGVDVSFNMLEIAKNSGFEVVQADAMFLPFRDGVFDVVSIYSVLHHIFDYRSVLSELGRVLTRKGFLYWDWDPNRIPDRAFPLRRIIDKAVRNMLALIAFYSISKNFDIKGVRVDSRHPDLSKRAEFHNVRGRERGIDHKLIEKSLSELGFTRIDISYHWAGMSKGDLFKMAHLSWVLRLLARPMSFFGLDLNDYMENVQIIAGER